MVSQSLNDIKAYAVKAVKQILPLDDESISQMVDYAVMNLRTRDAIYQHFVNLLGETSDALNFITTISNMLFGDTNKPVDTPKRNTKSSSGTPLQRSRWGESRSGSATPKLRQRKKADLNTSELLERKGPKDMRVEQHTKEVKLDSLKDLDAALSQLEVSDPRVHSKEVVRVCNCNATRHPLFEMFPNCLNCGKIICAKEGFQPCSFCGKPLLNNEERLEIIDILEKEKEQLEGKPRQAPQTKHKKKKKMVKVSISGTGQNNFKLQEKAFKQIERQRELDRKREEQAEKKQAEIVQVEKELEYYNSIKGKDEELIKAQQRLDTLMNFQDHGAERTKIIDHASDYESPNASNLWATPLERALQLKRQQKQLRRQEEADERRSGRGKQVVDMSIRDGKVFLRSVNAPDAEEDLSDDEEVKELKNQVSKEKSDSMNDAAKNVWNYKADASKWTKPVYIDRKEETGEAEAEAEAEESSQVPPPGSKQPLSKPVVQLGDDAEQEETIFSLTGL